MIFVEQQQINFQTFLEIVTKMQVEGIHIHKYMELRLLFYFYCDSFLKLSNLVLLLSIPEVTI
jgi:hypothetical protein